MNTKILFRSLILFYLCIIKINAQEVLTLENALKIALQNNFEIKLASNNLEINTTNVALGNAGMLPRLTANLVDANRIENSTQVRKYESTQAHGHARLCVHVR